MPSRALVAACFMNHYCPFQITEDEAVHCLTNAAFKITIKKYKSLTVNTFSFPGFLKDICSSYIYSKVKS